MSDQEYFDEATNEQFLEEDRQAWYAICTILMTIISIGLALAFLAVFLGELKKSTIARGAFSIL